MEPKVRLYSQRRRTGWNGRTAAMTQDPSGASPFSGAPGQGNNIAVVFRDPASKDYTLAENSPALALGIEEIDMAIGPRGGVMATHNN